MRDHIIQWFRFLLRGKPPAVALALLKHSFGEGELTQQEFLFLIDLPSEPGPRVNAPGGAC